jgi:hypothetical protein
MKRKHTKYGTLDNGKVISTIEAGKFVKASKRIIRSSKNNSDFSEPESFSPKIVKKAEQKRRNKKK